MASKAQPNTPFTIELNQFRTLNTKDSPVSMKDDELPLLINFMPIGTTLYTVPGYSAAPLVTIGNSEVTWAGTTAALLNASVVIPTVKNGFVYLCTTGGTTGNAEPTWPTTQGGTVNDNGVIWTAYSSTVKRMFSLNLGGTLYWLVATVGGAIYLVNAAWAQVRLCLPNLMSSPKFEQWKYTNGLIIDSVAGYFDYSGVNTCINAAGTAISSSAISAKIVNAIAYVVAMTQYQKAVTDNFWNLTGFNCTNAKFNSCYLYISTSGAASIAAGTEATTLGGVVMPAIDTTKSLVATLTVNPTGTGNFTGGTTQLNNSNGTNISAALAIATTATKVKTTAGVTYYIGTTQYTKVITDNLWDLTGFNCTHGNFNRAYLYLDTAGTASIGIGTQGANAGAVVMPTIDQTKDLVGTVQVNPTGAGNFTGGTTTLNDAGVVPNATFVNIVSVLPNPVFTDSLLLTPHTTLSAPTAGTCIAVFKSRVWIANGRTLSYSAPDSLVDFTTGNAGGTVIDNYSSLRNQINAMFSTSDYLYVVGDHATHTIYGVQVFSSGSTAFNLIDAVPGIGSVFPEASQVLGGTVYETGDGGSNAVSGADFQNFSAYLDGVFPLIDTSFSPVAFWAKIFNKFVYCLLTNVVSPIDGSKQKIIMCFYEQRWFFVFYGQNFTFVAQQATATDTLSYAAYGNNIIQIFTGTTTVLRKKARLKALNFGDPSHGKQILSIGATLVNTSGLLLPVMATMTAIGSGFPDASAMGSCTVTFTPGTMTWTNSLGNPIFWTNLAWSLPYNDMLGMQSCDGRGKRIQIDYDENSSAAYSLTGMLVEATLAENN